MEGRARIAHAAAGLTLLGLIASWLILLAAVSAVQKDCIGRCRILTGLPWWIIWFQFFTILLLAATQFVAGLRHGRTAVIALLAILATLQMYFADASLNQRGSGLSSESRVDAAISGYILLAVFNLLAILLLGFQPAGAAAPDDAYASNTNTYTNPVAKSGGTPHASGSDAGNMRPFQTARQASLGGSVPASAPPPSTV